MCKRVISSFEMSGTSQGKCYCGFLSNIQSSHTFQNVCAGLYNEDNYSLQRR